jgi:hypothetical protein
MGTANCPNPRRHLQSLEIWGKEKILRAWSPTSVNDPAIAVRVTVYRGTAPPIPPYTGREAKGHFTWRAQMGAGPNRLEFYQ